MVREGRDDAGAGARVGDDDPRGAARSREGSRCDRARLLRRCRRRRRRPARRRERSDQRCPLGDEGRPGDRRRRSPRVPARRLSGDARRRRAVAGRRSIHARARRRRVEDRDRRLHVDAPQVIAFRLPNPSVLLLSGVLVAAALTWVLPAGQYDQRDDAATGRRVAVPGTYHSVPRAPVGLLAAAVAVPRGFVAAAAGIAVKLAQLPLFAAGRLRLAMFVVGMIVWIAWTMRYASRNRAGRSAQSLALQSTLTVPSPGTNTVARGFQPSGCAGAEARGESARAEARGFQPSEPPAADATWHPRHALILAIVVAPIGAYVYGALRLDWGFNELSGAFLIAAVAAGSAARALVA